MAGKVKLIITDLDGTFLRSDKSISRFSLDVIKRCRKQGIYIAIATARSEWAAAKYIDLIKPDIVISNGGSLAKYRDKVIYQCMLSAETSDLLIKDCVADSDIGEITVETDEAYYCNSEELNESDGDYSHTKYNDYTNPLNCMTYKITVEVLENSIAEKIASKYPECSFLIFVGENWCRFAHRDATKINAINEIAKYLNISLEEVAAFGDDINDIGMIKHCGQGIAVSNAIKEILDCASHITGSNDEDGVAAFISENFL
ncbi:HAD family hydrolase [uncultured Clostridium sp.]|uniref:HAD family hydrolase n=1 Tax=uncultured Clostridium sp. TaxID=59620 RepID=UPI003217B1CF